MIIIDGLPLGLSSCGVKSFTTSFLKALDEYLLTHQPENRYLVLYPKISDQNTNSFIDEFKSGKIIFYPVSLPVFINHILNKRNLVFFWSFLIFPQKLKEIQKNTLIETVFHPYQVISNYSLRVKKIVAIHDIFHWVNSKRYNLIQRFFYQLAAQACQASDWVITVSEFSKQQIVNYLKIPSEKISTCYEGINSVYQQTDFPKAALEGLRNKFSLPRRYILTFLSTRKYKKNVIGSVRLYYELLKIQPNHPYQLVFVGGNLETNQEVKQYIINNKLLDRVNDDELRHLYHLADYLFFLSLEEGFGLPPLESLACGTFPVVSNTSSLGEIYSPYFPTFNPNKLKPIAQYLSKLTRAQREKIVIAAKEPLLKMYNWDRVIANYIKVLEA